MVYSMNQYTIKFDKYEALGNDFIIINKMNSSKSLKHPIFDKSLRIKLCDRNIGIGADGILTILPADNTEAICFMHITNADGSDALQCGNGLRCAILWLANNGFIDFAQQGYIDTPSGLKAFKITNDKIEVNMGEAKLIDDNFCVKINANKAFTGKIISVGNLHAIFTDINSDADLKLVAKFIDKNKIFANGINIEALTKKNNSEINISIWENGVGITKACGSGACASAAAFALQEEINFEKKIRVNMHLGYVDVVAKPVIAKKSYDVIMTGFANRVFSGEFYVNDH